jgi:hypothetical protein
MEGFRLGQILHHHRPTLQPRPAKLSEAEGKAGDLRETVLRFNLAVYQQRGTERGANRPESNAMALATVESCVPEYQAV